VSFEPKTLDCFKAYDIRGRIGAEIDGAVCRRVGRALAEQLGARRVVIGFDARETSPAFAAALSRGVREAGSDVLDLGLAGTEEMYWAVNHFGACAGATVTASHNPIDYNGIKIVGPGARPLDPAGDFQRLKLLAERGDWRREGQLGAEQDVSGEARRAYVERVLGFVDLERLAPLKILLNSGNGAAGPTLDALTGRLSELGVKADFVRMHHAPDAGFPNGIPNPLLPENQAPTANAVREAGADFGVAFDGDFDRCFLFDGGGAFVSGEYVVALLARAALSREPGAAIVHDPRVTWGTREAVAVLGGTAVAAPTGHAFLKAKMRETGAAYGGEMSAHHYFRDFAYCDSGMIPWLLVWQQISQTGKSLRELVAGDRRRFPSSGEMNFTVKDPGACLRAAEETYAPGALAVDTLDGLSLEFADWRFNLRKSNTEPLVRLNVEARGSAELVREKARELSAFIEGAPA